MDESGRVLSESKEVARNRENLLAALLNRNEARTQKWTDGSISDDLLHWMNTELKKDDTELYNLLLRELLLSDDRSDATSGRAGGRNARRVKYERSKPPSKDSKDKHGFQKQKLFAVEDWEYPNVILKDYDD